MRQLFIDIETTGFSRDWDSIIEIAAVITDKDYNEIDRFHEYIRPNKSIPAKITSITGITNEMVKNCRSEQEVMEELTQWIRTYNPEVVIGHNCKSFDLQFLNKKSEKYGYKFPQMEIADTLPMARRLIKEGKINTPNAQQPTIAKFFGIEYEAHSAIEDVRALILMYQRMKKLENNEEDKDICNYVDIDLGF